MAGRTVSGSKVLAEVLQRHAENDTLPLLNMATLPSKLSHAQKKNPPPTLAKYLVLKEFH